MNILFYFPSNKRTVAIESIMEHFIKKGNSVFLLTLSESDELHKSSQTLGVKTFEYVIPKKNSPIYYLRHLFFLIRFVRKNKIDIVYSHLQQANIIAVFAQYFTKARIILCRHHSDCAFVNDNRTEKIFDKVINLLGKYFIVPSKKVYKQMMEIEKANPKKIWLINYGYRFDSYYEINQNEVENIRNKYKAKLFIVKIARLVPEKRHIILLRVLNELIKNGFDIKALLISDGTEKQKLEKYISENKLSNNIFIIGYQKNVIDYLAASDLVVHVSESEASNSIIKEAGLVKKTVIVCKDVGDFDDYILNGVNGFSISKENPEKELKELIVDFYNKKYNSELLGQNLHEKIFELFSIEKVSSKYDEIHRLI